MTGYGRAEQTINDKVFLVELRSLNGKQYDIRLMVPALLKPYEFDIRNMLVEGLLRGSIEGIITLKQNGSAKPVTINTDLLKAYYTPVTEVAQELGLGTENILSTLLKLPEVVTPSTEILNEKEWDGFKKILQEAIAQLNEHRKDEGKSMEDDLIERIGNIEQQQQIISTLEPGRRE